MNTVLRMRVKSLLTLLVLTITVSCEEIDNSSYLNQWLGEYEGIYHSCNAVPNTDTAEIIWIENHFYGHVNVVVQRGDIDSSLNLTGTYRDTLTYMHYDLIFSSSGHHFSEYGAGSGYSRLTINIDTDSLHYDSWSKMGMNGYGYVTFNIGKKSILYQ